MGTKPIRFSRHARRRLELRGAAEAEVIKAILDKQWQPALQDRWRARKRFEFGRASPVNNKVYQFKILQMTQMQLSL